MDGTLGRFGDRRLERGGGFLHARLVAVGSRGVRVRRLGGNRAGEIRITRFLRNPAVSVEEMIETAAGRTGGRVAGRHVLAIQDTTTVRAEDKGRCIALHPVIAVDAVDGALLGLVDARFFVRTGGKAAQRKDKAFAEKESRRWLDGAERAAGALSGASCVTVVADREGDIYEDFACRPAAVEVLIRAGQAPSPHRWIPSVRARREPSRSGAHEHRAAGGPRPSGAHGGPRLALRHRRDRPPGQPQGPPRT